MDTCSRQWCGPSKLRKRSDSLASAFRKLGGRGLSMIPVVDQQRLIGIVTMQNLMHSMALLAETRRLRKQQEAGNRSYSVSRQPSD